MLKPGHAAFPLRQPGQLLAAAGFVLASLLPASAAFAQCAEPLSSLPWSSLQYSARKMFAQGEFDISLSRLDQAEAAAALWPVEQTAALQPCAGLLKLEARLRFLTQRARLQCWLDPAGLYMYQRWRLTSGGDSRVKTARFLPDGVWWTRREPAQAGNKQPAELWPVQREKRIPLPTISSASHWFEATSLLLLVAGDRLSKPGDVISVPVFMDQQAFKVSLQVHGTTRREADYLVISDTGREGISGRRELLQIDLHYRPLGSLEDEPEFNLLGLTDNIRIYRDANGLPVLLEGDIEAYDGLSIKLKQADLRPNR